MTISRITACALTLAFLLAACGQRGPLYLPDETAQPPVAAAASLPEDTLDAELDEEKKLQDGNLEVEQEDEP
jgi:predicted small lipoprotein YifL